MRNMFKEVEKIELEDFNGLAVVASTEYKSVEGTDTLHVVNMENEERNIMMYALNDSKKDYLTLMVVDLEEVKKEVINEECPNGEVLARQSAQYFDVITEIRVEEDFKERVAVFMSPKSLWSTFEKLESLAEKKTELAQLIEELKEEE